MGEYYRYGMSPELHPGRYILPMCRTSPFTGFYAGIAVQVQAASKRFALPCCTHLSSPSPSHTHTDETACRTAPALKHDVLVHRLSQTVDKHPPLHQHPPTPPSPSASASTISQISIRRQRDHHRHHSTWPYLYFLCRLGRGDRGNDRYGSLSCQEWRGARSASIAAQVYKQAAAAQPTATPPFREHSPSSPSSVRTCCRRSASTPQTRVVSSMHYRRTSSSYLRVHHL